ncbi:uncharacterized protein PAC_04888 [Phialocephala subalpina]|uniref:Transcription factor domain-containing protein n=1 Tax=Phialocephala subalpina TaxID=576137 RepID=A0A1L7WQF7_9HELO|nr:uncharacterized protein PAC_04888 [Phialocephala subalpina]
MLSVTPKTSNQEQYLTPHDNTHAVPASDASHAGFGTLGVSSAPVHAAANLRPNKADDCLDLFRTQMLKFFAFLHLPEVLSAQQLRQERPFLFLCIMAVTSRITEKKMAKHKEIKQILAQRMILQNAGDVNLDLLLGLLTFLAWGQDQLLNNTPTSLSRFTSFAMSRPMTLVFDLRLNKPPLTNSNMLPTLKSYGVSTTAIDTTRNIDERRAALGCFSPSSMCVPVLPATHRGARTDIASISSYFGQIDALGWTPYMSECFDILIESGTQASEAAEQAWAKAFESTTVPPDFYLKPFQSKLDELVRPVPIDIQQDTLFLASMYPTKLSIYAMAIFKAPFNVDNAGFHRLESLYNSLSTVKSALNNFFTLPPSKYLGLSFPFFAQLAQYIITLLRLSTFECPTWDTGFVRSTVDVILVLDRIINNLQQVHVNSRADVEDIIRDKTVKILGFVGSWCAVRLTSDHSGGTNSEAIEGDGTFTEPIFLEGMDDIWMRDIFRF